MLAWLIAACGLSPMALAQGTSWDTTLSNSHWYVPVPYLISYISNNRSFAVPGPTVLGDQTLWAIGPASHGVFSGTSSTTLSNGLITSSSAMNMRGVVTDSGQIVIEFTPTTADGITTLGVGQMRSIGGQTLMEMQMTTGGSLLLTHWAYMAAYNPASFTPPPPTQVITADLLSPQWRWAKGTTWRLVSPDLFGTTNPGTFKISDYNSGYFWGQGVGPNGSPVGNFTQIGSITPEGNLLFSLLSDGALTNLTGQIAGDGASGAMVLHPYATSGVFGSGAVASLVTTPSAIAAGMTFFASDLGGTVTPAFAGGTLQIDVAGAYPQNFTLDAGSNTIDQRGRLAIFTGDFSDATPGVPGRLIIANSESTGAIVLAGASTYTGPTTVTAGATLVVDGSIVSPVTVDGTLRGTGLIAGATTISPGGTLAPGNSPGTLAFAAPVVLSAGSTLQVDIDGPGTGTGAGNYSRVLVTSNSFTAGGTLLPLLRGISGSATNGFTPALGQQFAVVNAVGGIAGRFSGLVQPVGLAAGTRFDALYGANTITLAATPASYANLGLAGLPQTASQASVGGALDSIRPVAGRGLDGASTLFAPLFALPGNAIGPALDQLAPTIYGDALLAARGAWYGFRDQIAAQLAGRRAGCRACEETPGPFGTRLWTSGLAQYSTVAASTAPGFQTAQTGAMVGLELPFRAALAGIAVGGSGLRTSASTGAQADGTMLHLALYGAVEASHLLFTAQLGYALIEQGVTRPLGPWATATHGDLSVGAVGGDVAGSWRLVLGDWRVEPTAGLAVVSLSAPALSEQAAPLAQQIAGQALTSVRSLLSLPVGRRFDLGEQMVGLRGTLGWAHEFADTAATTNAAFAFAPNVTFAVTAAAIDRDQLVLGVAADVALRQGVALTAGYQAQLGDRASTHGVRAGLRVSW
jgi:autotransporter-associated beta strand protein